MRLEILEKYKQAFTKLRRANQHGGAPHKPLLLLAVLEGVSRGQITSNAIAISPELILCFKEYWSKLVITPHKMNFALPFYHMQTEKFWRLINQPGRVLALTSSHSVKSLGALHEALLHAEIDPELFLLMNDAGTNRILKELLIQCYFPHAKDVAVQYTALRELQEAILNETHHQYVDQLNARLRAMSKEEEEEELFVRGSLFKREIPRQYNYSCAISRIRIVTATPIQMVDACHIVPFAISKDDTIRNGISLSPTLHRAFDRGLIALSNDYTVMVSQHVYEDPEAPFLTPYQGQPILHPNNNDHLPAIENLSWHRHEVYLG